MRQSEVQDLTRQVARLIGTANSVLERYSRLAEEYDSTRLANEEVRAILRELVEEFGIWAGTLSKRIDRLEQYIILVRMGQDTAQITQQVEGEHIRRKGREELAGYQEQLLTYHKNMDRVRLMIAKRGYPTIEESNQLDDWQLEVDRLTEAIDRMREALNVKTVH